MVDAVMQGGEAEVNDTKSYDNGTGVIPTYLCEPVVVTIDNYKEMLIDSGYYTERPVKVIRWTGQSGRKRWGESYRREKHPPVWYRRIEWQRYFWK